MVIYTFVADPSHAWLAVDFQSIADVGLSPADFSEYSYITELGMYLEEDCDATKFLVAYSERYGKAPQIGEKYFQECYVRELPCNDGSVSI